ncbi:pentapeptide repeat-containing protein [Nonomuraea sp. NPDC049400]|uniref:pentapeptide repeat-containing protein n=1 Tax=Nonomuraea sp. NPDC049400 TaxID=3364352 RepID=UPI0037B2F321
MDGVTLNDDIPPPATLPPNELTAKDWAAALASVRGNVLAVATGLAALLAVFYTARNADTARRTFQLGEHGHDTDRFSKAVEQLGSSQAPVRLGGLYALEQLAQNNPGLRQTVVDVVCAYLRMPWTPPRKEDRQEQIRAAQRASRTRSPGRAEARVTRDPDEERQVRLTAQRLLVNHLLWQKPRWWERSTAANPLFWPGIRLDLTGATLLDFNFNSRRVHQAHFNGATFIGPAGFNNVTFSGPAWFGGATFTGDVWFGETIFSETARFNGATFTGDVWFGKVIFSGDARFNGATFTGDALFAGTRGTHIWLAGARVLHPDGEHVWPPGWRVKTGPSGAVLERDEPPDGGAENEQVGESPPPYIAGVNDRPT